MATNLAVKHKDSLTLKENKLLQDEQCQKYKSYILKKYKCLSLPWWIWLVFLFYWFIICPLIWAICYVFKIHWPPYWTSLFWLIALLIYILLLCGMMICWRRRLQSKPDPEKGLLVTAKYGSDKIEFLSIQQKAPSADANSSETKKTEESRELKSKKDPGSSRRKDLPPLLIHKQMSSEDIEDTTGVAQVEKDENGELNVAGGYVEKSPLQDYLKLVTVTPMEDEVKTSPKTPMSPRELFFIDLIREAERVESAKSSKSETRFFPSEVVKDDKDTKDVIEIEDAKDVENTKCENNTKDTEDAKEQPEINEKDKEDETKSKRESSYFIANVESPTSEKTEVFLEIDSKANEQIELSIEKPVLVLQSNETNSQES